MNKVDEFLAKHEYTAWFGIDPDRRICCARFPERVDSIRRKRMVHTYEFDYNNNYIIHTLGVGDKVIKAPTALPRHIMRLYVHFNFQITCNTFMRYNFYHVRFHVGDEPSDYFSVYKNMLPALPMISDIEKEPPILEHINKLLPILPVAAEAGIDNECLRLDYHILRTALLGAYETMETLHNE
jgi:hypothetical protein